MLQIQSSLKMQWGKKILIDRIASKIFLGRGLNHDAYVRVSIFDES